MSDSFSVIILTYNEEKNIGACLESLRPLNAEIFIVDSGSTDKTLEICLNYTSNIVNHQFENYSIQRNWALNNLAISSNWILNMDADHRVTSQLTEELIKTFSKPIDLGINGFLVSRRTMFMGKWIKHGGHYPTYHAILFRKGYGQCEDKLYDQHFKVTGKTQVMKSDMIDIITDSLTTFIARHNHWATLEAQYHFHDLNKDEVNQDVVKAKFFGNPIERRRYIKKRYERFPLFVRPVIYYLIRYFIRLGILDGSEGLVFHFLQGFWFRFLIDAKIYELNKAQKIKPNPSAPAFFFKFILLFICFYYFNIFYFGLTLPGGFYSPFCAHYLDYISGLRWLLLNCSRLILDLMGYSSICDKYDLLVAGHGYIRVVYACLGIGMISFFSAFVIAYPKPLKNRLIFLSVGIISIELLNILRFILLELFWNKIHNRMIDHHTLFNTIIVLVIIISLYFWVKSDDKTLAHAAD